MTSKLRIAVIASSRHPIREPFAGGLEAQVWTLVQALRRRRHEVTLFAGPGSDPDLGAESLPVRKLRLTEAACTDVSMPARQVMEEHHAYLALMLELSRSPSSFDVVHNHSLHYLPIAMADLVDTPMIATLHTPPTPWIESAVQLATSERLCFTAVSAHTAGAWRRIIPDVTVVANGIDTDVWRKGPGGEDLVWMGRITPEKGTHLAAEAARRAKRSLKIAGPISDVEYFSTKVQPLLGDSVRYVGHLSRSRLVELVGRSAACLVTPCWDEPYGLVVAEALACGTPVAGFAIGALPEITSEACARLVTPGDVEALATAAREATDLSRAYARRWAEERCSLDAMVDAYERLYHAGSAAA